MNNNINNNEIFWDFFDFNGGTWEEKVNQLLDKGIPIDVQDDEGRTILHRAIEDDYSYLAELMLENGANPNIEDKNGDTPLDYAEYRGCHEVIEKLITKGAIKRDRQSEISKLHESMEAGQQHARAMQTLFSLIDKHRSEKKS